MRPSWWPGEQHEQFTEWAFSQGIEANGVTPARFPGRGLGMIATRNIKEGEVIVTVPSQAMFTIHSIPASFIRKFESTNDISVHGLLAAFLTHGDSEHLEKYDLWRKAWPTRKDFEDSMPILWPRDLRVSNSEYDDGNSNSSKSTTISLPPSISGRWNSIQKGSLKHKYATDHQNLLAQQEKRLCKAWESVLTVFPKTDWGTYSYHWLIVNTRCFFYVTPGEDPPDDRNDAIALLPFADYFNHSDVACNVNFDNEKYTFRAAKPYEKGEEIFMSYGPHPNDFLFAEYGFFLDQNESDAIYLDDIVFRDLTPSDKDELELQQYYGNYQITSTGACYRTEIVASMKYMPRRDWRNYVLGHSVKGVDSAKSEAIIQGWIREYIKEADMTIAGLEDLGARPEENEDAGKIDMLLKRWRQIRGLCEQALEAMSC